MVHGGTIRTPLARARCLGGRGNAKCLWPRLRRLWGSRCNRHVVQRATVRIRENETLFANITETKWSDLKLYGLRSIETKDKEAAGPGPGARGRNTY